MALTKTRKLVEKDEVHVLAGGLLAPTGYALAPYVDAQRVPTVIPLIAADDLTQRKPARWMIRTGWTSSQAAHPFGEYAAKVLGYKKIAAIAMDYAFGWEMVGGFQKTFEDNGSQIVQKIWTPMNVTDYGPYLGQLRKDVDAVFALHVGRLALQFVKQYHQAMAKHEAAQVTILSAQIDQAKAQLSLLEDQLSRTRVLAFFNGMVVSGDLSQQLGSPVERGQVLFEVAPLDAYRVIVQVDERDIADVAVGQRGQLLLSAFPHESLPFRVEKITPVSTAKEGRNTFRVEAQLERTPARLRPGMEGVGKIEVGRRRLIWIWTHQVIDWVRLKLWTWLP